MVKLYWKRRCLGVFTLGYALWLTDTQNHYTYADYRPASPEDLQALVA